MPGAVIDTADFGLQAPIYNFKTSSREGHRTIKVPESRVVIVEGIYALSEKIRCVRTSLHSVLIVVNAVSTILTAPMQCMHTTIP
jgi:uridine kinase